MRRKPPSASVSVDGGGRNLQEMRGFADGECLFWLHALSVRGQPPPLRTPKTRGITGYQRCSISEMQKESRREKLDKRTVIRRLESTTAARSRFERQQIQAAHRARHIGVTWKEIAEASGKRSAAAAASYFGENMADRELKRAAARSRARNRPA